MVSEQMFKISIIVPIRETSQAPWQPCLLKGQICSAICEENNPMTIPAKSF